MLDEENKKRLEAIAQENANLTSAELSAALAEADGRKAWATYYKHQSEQQTRETSCDSYAEEPDRQEIVPPPPAPPALPSPPAASHPYGQAAAEPKGGTPQDGQGSPGNDPMQVDSSGVPDSMKAGPLAFPVKASTENPFTTAKAPPPVGVPPSVLAKAPSPPPAAPPVMPATTTATPRVGAVNPAQVPAAPLAAPKPGSQPPPPRYAPAAPVAPAPAPPHAPPPPLLPPAGVGPPPVPRSLVGDRVQHILRALQQEGFKFPAVPWDLHGSTTDNS